MDEECISDVEQLEVVNNTYVEADPSTIEKIHLSNPDIREYENIEIEVEGGR